MEIVLVLGMAFIGLIIGLMDDDDFDYKLGTFTTIGGCVLIVSMVCGAVFLS